MDEGKEPAKKNLSSKNISEQRARALDLAFIATRLLDEKYYNDFSHAVNTDNRDLFLNTCEAAKVPSDIANLLWGLLRGKGLLPGVW